MKKNQSKLNEYANQTQIYLNNIINILRDVNTENIDILIETQNILNSQIQEIQEIQDQYNIENIEKLNKKIKRILNIVNSVLKYINITQNKINKELLNRIKEIDNDILTNVLIELLDPLKILILIYHFITKESNILNKFSTYMFPLSQDADELTNLPDKDEAKNTILLYYYDLIDRLILMLSGKLDESNIDGLIIEISKLKNLTKDENINIDDPIIKMLKNIFNPLTTEYKEFINKLKYYYHKKTKINIYDIINPLIVSLSDTQKRILLNNLNSLNDNNDYNNNLLKAMNKAFNSIFDDEVNVINMTNNIIDMKIDLKKLGDELILWFSLSFNELVSDERNKILMEEFNK